MSIDVSDIVDHMLDDQARVNAAVDDGDINNQVADFQGIAGETVGGGTETVTAIAEGSPPHLWNDGQSAFGFFTWA